jgi:hypothetical protein
MLCDLSIAKTILDLSDSGVTVLGLVTSRHRHVVYLSDLEVVGKGVNVLNICDTEAESKYLLLTWRKKMHATLDDIKDTRAIKTLIDIYASIVDDGLH